MKISLEYREDKAYITRANLSKILLVTYQQIIAYEKRDNPLRRAEIGEKTIYYDLLYALRWNAEEIDHKHRPQRDDFTGVAQGRDEEYKVGDNITASNMKIAKELEAAQNEKIKRQQGDLELKIKKGQYIQSDISDKASAQVIRLLLTNLHSLKDAMPQRLIECESIKEIRDVTDIEYEKLINTIASELGKYE